MGARRKVCGEFVEHGNRPPIDLFRLLGTGRLASTDPASSLSVPARSTCSHAAKVTSPAPFQTAGLLARQASSASERRCCFAKMCPGSGRSALGPKSWLVSSVKARLRRTICLGLFKFSRWCGAKEEWPWGSNRPSQTIGRLDQLIPIQGHIGKLLPQALCDRDSPAESFLPFLKLCLISEPPGEPHEIHDQLAADGRLKRRFGLQLVEHGESCCGRQPRPGHNHRSWKCRLPMLPYASAVSRRIAGSSLRLSRNL